MTNDGANTSGGMADGAARPGTTTHEGPRRSKRQWIGLAITTVLGIAATFAVGMYQLNRAERQAILAAQERARSVRESIVSIVEEHMLNGKSIDLPRLARLIDQRRRSEGVDVAITLAEVIEQAEFNTLNSRYLTFQRKEEIKPVFDSLYTALASAAFAPYPRETPNSDLLNSIAARVQESKTAEALEGLKRLQEAHAHDVTAAVEGRNQRSFEDSLRQLAKSPTRLLIIVLFIAANIIVFITLFPGNYRLRRALTTLLFPWRGW